MRELKFRVWDTQNKNYRQHSRERRFIGGKIMSNRKEIVQYLEQDIYKLVDIARTYAPSQQVQDEITIAVNRIYEGLGDYELDCRKEALDQIDAFLNPGNKEEE